MTEDLEDRARIIDEVRADAMELGAALPRLRELSAEDPASAEAVAAAAARLREAVAALARRGSR